MGDRPCRINPEGRKTTEDILVDFHDHQPSGRRLVLVYLETMDILDPFHPTIRLLPFFAADRQIIDDQS